MEESGFSGCSRIQGIRAPWSKLAMAALAETTVEGHEVCCRGGEIIPATHFPPATSLSNSGENKWLCHVIPGSKLCVEHVATQIQMMGRRRDTEHVNKILSRHAFVNGWTWNRVLSITPRHVARVFSTCYGAGEGESGSRLPDDCFASKTPAMVVTPVSEVAITLLYKLTVALRVSTQLFAPGAIRPSISTHQMTPSLVSLSSSLPAGWPCTRATPRASSSRFLKIV